MGDMKAIWPVRNLLQLSQNFVSPLWSRPNLEELWQRRRYLNRNLVVMSQSVSQSVSQFDKEVAECTSIQIQIRCNKVKLNKIKVSTYDDIRCES